MKNRNFKRGYLLPAEFAVVLGLTLSSLGCVAPRERLYYSAPTVISQTSRQMQTPGFWISRNPDPDRVIMDPGQIERFNSRISEELGLIRDIASLGDSYPGKRLADEFNKQIKGFQRQGLYMFNGKKAGRDFYKTAEDLMALAEIEPQIRVKFGFICAFANQRLLPLEDGLYAKIKDLDFDELQNSSLDISTPVAVLHQSSDGKWLYLLSPLSDGWVRAENVVLCGRQQLKDLLSSRRFSVVISAKADIFLDEQLTDHYDCLRMGSRIKAQEDPADGIARVSIPARDGAGGFIEKTAYIKKTDLNPGYLPYTPRNMIEQAFKQLNSPYGWGGMNGEADCSQFIKEVFACSGIYLPRNSSSQARIGALIAEFNNKEDSRSKRGALGKAWGGITILGLKGHIMLFLGMVDARPYAIHSLWAYRQRSGGKDTVRLVNRVAVTGLDLGEGSAKGSLLQRIKNVRQISD